MGRAQTVRCGITWVKSAGQKNPQYGYTYAFYLYRAGQLDEAIKAIHTVRQRHPTHEDSMLLERQLLQEQEEKRAGSPGH